MPVLSFPGKDTPMTQQVDTGSLWKWVDRLTQDRRHRLVRKAEGKGRRPVVEYVKVDSLWKQLLEAVASTNSGGGRGKSSPGSRSPLDLAAMDLVADIERTVIDELAKLGSPARPLTADGDRIGIDVPAELRHLAAQIVSLAKPETIAVWSAIYRGWVARAETTLTADDESIDMRAVRGHACPDCLALWVTSMRDGELYRDAALVIAFREGQVLHITCRACQAGWWRGDDINQLTKDLEQNEALFGDARQWGETVSRSETA